MFAGLLHLAWRVCGCASGWCAACCGSGSISVVVHRFSGHVDVRSLIGASLRICLRDRPSRHAVVGSLRGASLRFCFCVVLVRCFGRCFDAVSNAREDVGVECAEREAWARVARLVPAKGCGAPFLDNACDASFEVIEVSCFFRCCVFCFFAWAIVDVVVFRLG